jgi:galactokinase
VREDAVEKFVDLVPGLYRDVTGLRATAHVCRAADGATVSTYDL